MQTLYFYDLETSGFSARDDRIMQFAGQRTDQNLNLIGDPHNYLIKMTRDILPDPQAVLLTGITPQSTIQDGISEADFLRIFYKEIATPNTTFVGFNSVRFDDEFMRFLNYRNFYDPYEWSWKDGRSRWDLLDVVRMTRALRPGSLIWPKDSEGKSVNRLEELALANNIIHESAHDALSDVGALIGFAKLVLDSQPKLFNYLREVMCSKDRVAQLVNQELPFIYCSGKYESIYEKTTAVCKIADHPSRQAAVVFDLRQDSDRYISMSKDELMEAWMPEGKPDRHFPIKTLMYNRCPAIAPISVLDEESEHRLSLNIADINKNYETLNKLKSDFGNKVLDVIKLMDKAQNAHYEKSSVDYDSQLYDGFYNNQDKTEIRKIHQSTSSELNIGKFVFSDARLNGLLPLYKARNYPKTLSQEEQIEWETFRERRLLSGKENSRMAKYFNRLEEIKNSNLSSKKSYLVEELKLYGESLLPN